ncbi:hypothetical protein WISP_43811 [Willisornis vidua]|uniref:Uncharacterized protein n=1 Tax=Willisornis vidua TaxID=1566151 RepID=A0ABQ9DG27_9PASS|nr:hypothetical protein WISP_43811 [Willisornis vidua]
MLKDKSRHMLSVPPLGSYMGKENFAMSRLEEIHSKSGGDKKLGGDVDSLKGRKTLQRDLNRLEDWAITNYVNFKRGMSRGNPGCTHRLGNEMLASSAMERDLGVLVDGKLNVAILAYIKNNVASRIREVLVPQYSALVRPHLKFCVQFWATHYQRDIEVLELVKGLEHKSCEEWLREMRLFSLEKRRFRGDLIALYNYLKGDCGKVGLSLYSQAAIDRRGGHSLTLHQERFRLDMRKIFFTNRVVKLWNRLPREVVESPCLEVQEVTGCGT